MSEKKTKKRKVSKEKALGQRKASREGAQTPTNKVPLLNLTGTIKSKKVV